MATQLPPVPPPPDNRVQRFDAQGRPTPAQVAYEQKMKIYLDAVKAKLETL